MAYTTNTVVKTFLGISTTTHDALITSLIADADDWIDSQLRPYMTVPIGSPPDLVVAASKWIASGFFILNRPGRHGTEDVRGDKMVDTGKDMIKEYTQAFYTGQDSPGTWNVAITTAGPRGAMHSLESEYEEMDSV